jgi:hypothetical protein
VKKFFNWVLVLAACAGLVYGIGLIVPRSLTSGSKAAFDEEPEPLFLLAADVASWPRWHPDVASVRERPAHGERAVWSITTKKGDSYELEVTAFEEPRLFQGTYTIGGSRITWRYEFGWYGRGRRAHVTRTVETRDPWQRAKQFFLPRGESTPLAVLNAMTADLGLAAKSEAD